MNIINSMVVFITIVNSVIVFLYIAGERCAQTNRGRAVIVLRVRQEAMAKIAARERRLLPCEREER